VLWSADTCGTFPLHRFFMVRTIFALLCTHECHNSRVSYCKCNIVPTARYTGRVCTKLLHVMWCKS